MAQVPPSANSTDRDHPFVKHVESVYAQLLKSERQGDVELFKKIRTKAVVAGTFENLKRMGKPAGELGPMLKRAASWQTDVSQFKFIRVDTRQGVARLLYQREGKDEQGPTIEFAAIMTHWEDGAWRIGWVANDVGPKIVAGKVRSIDELANHPKLSL